MEGGPKKEVIDLQENAEGVWELLANMNLSPETLNKIGEIDGFGAMTYQEQISSLHGVADELSPKNEGEILEKNKNKFICRELDKVAQMLAAYQQIQDSTALLDSFGTRLDVRA
ncbi:MAG: hypothetical protein KC877_00075 [Candidatus Kaiserbacteria bacterium]|nr:hypothetical protein [Candidatus Kaiserbacteria bacterium]MCB9816626.1 hypothetical protein [Candidatus Nomurabacteria bacterium]